MARTVADVALMLSAIAGPDARSPIAIAESGSLFRRRSSATSRACASPGGRDLGGLPVDRRVARGRCAAAVFESLGCIVEEADPDLTGADEVFKTLRALAFRASCRE